jgi:hypothetical protein
MADEQARKEAALQSYRSKLLHHKARGAPVALRTHSAVNPTLK